MSLLCTGAFPERPGVDLRLQHRQHMSTPPRYHSSFQFWKCGTPKVAGNLLHPTERSQRRPPRKSWRLAHQQPTLAQNQWRLHHPHPHHHLHNRAGIALWTLLVVGTGPRRDGDQSEIKQLFKIL